MDVDATVMFQRLLTICDGGDSLVHVLARLTCGQPRQGGLSREEAVVLSHRQSASRPTFNAMMHSSSTHSDRGWNKLLLQSIPKAPQHYWLLVTEQRGVGCRGAGNWGTPSG